jgi:hypothetical protein
MITFCRVCPEYFQIIAVIHIRHCSKCWPDFTKHFVLNGVLFLHSQIAVFYRSSQSDSLCFPGGLEALVRLFDHSNLTLRGQAIEIFFKVTNDDIFPWFSFNDEDEAIDGDDNTARVKMASLASCDIVSKLLANRPGSITFPGGTFLALQLFAFFASFLRVWTGRYIRLSGEILNLLQEWQARSDVEHEEAALAAKLHEDFSRFGTAEDTAHAAAERQRRTLGDDKDEDYDDEEKCEDIKLRLYTLADNTRVSDTTSSGNGTQSL